MNSIAQNNEVKISISFIEGGGVTSAKGFKASGIHAGFRANPNRKDMALLVADEPCATAAAFTKNVFCAAPVQFSKQQLEASSGNPGYGCMKAIVINSGKANAATGARGLEVARAEVDIVSDAIGCPAGEVLVASTGVIGVELPLQPFEEGIAPAVAALSEDGGTDAAHAIMTTDTYAKECAVKCSFERPGGEMHSFTVGGMVKGSGMIMPNMATMIAAITTDIPIADIDLHSALIEAVDVSFNKVTVDSDTSTNDTCFLMASGAVASSGLSQSDLTKGSLAYDVFVQALSTVCIGLAREVAKDGEGATKLISVDVVGAKDDTDADLAARAVANSPLVKTAVAGRDANWGRIAAALGKSGAVFSQENVSIDIMGIPVCRDGLTQAFDEDEALRRFEDREIEIFVDLGEGEASTTVWTCDLTHDYISINADYRS